MASVTLRFFAAARAAAGVPELFVTGADRLSIADALTMVTPTAADYDDVVSRSSFLVNAVATADRDRILADGDVVDVLPPFAGG